MKKIVLAIFCISLIGCATPPPTTKQLANADYGAYPSNYKETVKNYMAEYLIDPYSAVFSHWQEPSEGYVADSGYIFGYRVCVEVNAKNRMGGYAGKKPHFFIIKNDNVVYR